MYAVHINNTSLDDIIDKLEKKTSLLAPESRPKNIISLRVHPDLDNLNFIVDILLENALLNSHYAQANFDKTCNYKPTKTLVLILLHLENNGLLNQVNFEWVMSYKNPYAIESFLSNLSAVNLLANNFEQLKQVGNILYSVHMKQVWDQMPIGQLTQTHIDVFLNICRQDKLSLADKYANLLFYINREILDTQATIRPRFS